ncbi:MAG: glycosyltransferase family A protein [Pseudohongiella nitratireducens]|nr:glycosyltransferase family A protein [Pseudohongiella nitratireducens]MDF1622653.1 glycosyltransferase family A protein [Pseudohongiella nitratireducens]
MSTDLLPEKSPRIPLVSVIMPVYNASEFLHESIESVLRQTCHDLELIVINDASTDGSDSIIQELASFDSRIKYVCLSKNSGVSMARNTGISLASGSYIAFIDADDFWYPNKLSCQLALMAEEGSACSHTYYFRVSNDGLRTLVESPSRVTYIDMLSSNYIGNSTAIYKSATLGRFFQEPIGHEDYKMWLQVLRKTDSICVQEPLVDYRVVSGSLSSNILKGLKWHWDIIIKEDGVNFISAVPFMIKYIYSAIRKRI